MIQLPPQPERDWIGSMEQLAGARLVTLAEGSGRGDRMVLVNNGSGLNFTIAPDRGMDLVECAFMSVPLAFRTPVGYSSGTRFEPAGYGWLRNWQGGLLTTAGLRNAGNPNGEFGLHGRISNSPAELFGIEEGLDDMGCYRIIITGTLREVAMFGENLRMRRTISTGYQDNSIHLVDEITNCNPHEEALQILYHCNFGYPFATPELRFSMNGGSITARTPKAEQNINVWNRLETPTPDYEEECFSHDLPVDDAGRRHFSVFNPACGVGVELDFRADELPNFVQWKNCQTGNYALGLEPCNVSLAGRAADMASGKARILKPYETMNTDLILHFHQH
jgi:hypothetical protein